MDDRIPFTVLVILPDYLASQASCIEDTVFFLHVYGLTLEGAYNSAQHQLELMYGADSDIPYDCTTIACFLGHLTNLYQREAV